MTDGHRTLPLLPADAGETAAVMAEVFTGAEPMTRALGLSAAQYRELTEIVCRDAADAGLGTIVRDGEGAGRVVAFSVSERWPPPPAFDPIPAMLAGFEVLRRLEEAYEARFAADPAALHVFFIGCVPAARRRGLTRLAVLENLQQGARAGLRRAFTEATNDGSAAVFASAGFATLAEVEYATFEYAGGRPFAGIPAGAFGPPVKSCRLMVRDLTPGAPPSGSASRAAAPG